MPQDKYSSVTEWPHHSSAFRRSVVANKCRGWVRSRRCAIIPRRALDLSSGHRRDPAAVRGKTFEDFSGNWLLRQGMQRGIEIVSEATRHITPDVQAARPAFHRRRSLASATCCDTSITGERRSAPPDPAQGRGGAFRRDVWVRIRPAAASERWAWTGRWRSPPRSCRRACRRTAAC